MTLRLTCILLCIVNFIVIGIVIALICFAKYLINRCNHYESQSEIKTEYICTLNNMNDELKKENNILYDEIKSLKGAQEK